MKNIREINTIKSEYKMKSMMKQLLEKSNVDRNG